MKIIIVTGSSYQATDIEVEVLPYVPRAIRGKHADLVLFDDNVPVDVSVLEHIVDGKGTMVGVKFK